MGEGTDRLVVQQDVENVYLSHRRRRACRLDAWTRLPLPPFDRAQAHRAVSEAVTRIDAPDRGHQDRAPRALDRLRGLTNGVVVEESDPEALQAAHLTPKLGQLRSGRQILRQAVHRVLQTCKVPTDSPNSLDVLHRAGQRAARDRPHRCNGAAGHEHQLQTESSGEHRQARHPEIHVPVFDLGDVPPGARPSRDSTRADSCPWLHERASTSVPTDRSDDSNQKQNTILNQVYRFRIKHPRRWCQRTAFRRATMPRRPACSYSWAVPWGRSVKAAAGHGCPSPSRTHPRLSATMHA